MQGYRASQKVSEISIAYIALIPKELSSFPLQISSLNFLYTIWYSHWKKFV